MKRRDAVRVDTLRMVRAALQNAAIESGRDLTDDDTAAVIDKEAKKRKEAIEAYDHAGREDLAAKERSEFEVLTQYLPDQLTEVELEEMVAAAIVELGATSRKDMGAVMKTLMPQVRGRAEGKLVSQLVAERLSN